MAGIVNRCHRLLDETTDVAQSILNTTAAINQRPLMEIELQLMSM